MIMLVRRQQQRFAPAPPSGMRVTYAWFCQQVRHHAKAPSKCHWGKRLLPFALAYSISLIPEDWQHIAQTFRRCNEPRWQGASTDSSINSS
jgi:hypothetical protein